MLNPPLLPSLRSPSTGFTLPDETKTSVESTPASFDFADIDVPDLFKDIDAASLKREAETWEKAPKNTRGSPPLNKEQRELGRLLWRLISYREMATARGMTPNEIETNLEAYKQRHIILLLGPGGSGKTEVINILTQLLQDERIGYLLATAYTGVASANFRMATLLMIFSLTSKTSLAKWLRATEISPVDFEKMHARFESVTGMRFTDIVMLVIDECSFLDARILGHVDTCCRILAKVHDVPFGGLVTVFAGDNHQKKGVGMEPWHRVLVEESINPTHPIGTAVERGVALLKRARRFNLEENMRARHNPDFAEAQKKLRDTKSTEPVTDAFLDRLAPYTPPDYENDMSWRFPLTAVAGHKEQRIINYKMMHQFAQFYNLPVVRWKQELLDPYILGDDIDKNKLYEAEPTLWMYFVRAMPAICRENTAPRRGIANSSPCLFEDLDFGSDGPPTHYTQAMLRGNAYTTITLEKAPTAIIVRIGSKARKNSANDIIVDRHTWHGKKLDDWSDHLPKMLTKPKDRDRNDEAMFNIAAIDDDNDDADDADDAADDTDDTDDTDNLVPITVSTHYHSDMDAEMTSIISAQFGIPRFVPLHTYPLEIAWALTDFKVQGRTLLRLLLFLMSRTDKLKMDLESFYVLTSRGTGFEALRTLLLDDAMRQKLKNLLHNPSLAAYDDCYDLDGFFQPEHCSEAQKRAIANHDYARKLQTKTKKKTRRLRA